MNNIDYLNIIEEELKKDVRKKFRQDYYIPPLWLDPENPPNEHQNVNPYKFYMDIIEKIKSVSWNIKSAGKPIIYNMFVRYSCAYNHENADEAILPDEEENKIRRTGTFLKAIALLPYIKSLGVDIIYLLPVTSVGVDGRKGNLGSPYAIKNPMKLDDNLGDPLIDADVETQMKAFIEAAHLMGMKVVLEFVFRTASIDSDLALDHPDWFYWIKAKTNDRDPGSKLESQYGPPVFSDKEIKKIKSKVEEGDFKNLPEPHDKHKNLFTETPKKVARVEEKIRGVNKNKELRLPGAFADWPPDDLQPPWSDVTYLKMYDHPDFNYIAYNTIRMYDNRLAKDKYANEQLWEFIKEIIPHYQNEYKIDGVMVDMGHAMPAKLMADIIKIARQNDKNFIFWEENFHLNKTAVENGYNASFGYLPFDQYNVEKMKALLHRFAAGDMPVDFFATPESHNTPRAMMRYNNIDYLKACWAMNLFLPTLAFIHSGYELGEETPVNTGLDFTEEEQKRFPPEKLPLFSDIAIDWTNVNRWIDWLRKIVELRRNLFIDEDFDLKDTVSVPESSNQDAVCFIRKIKSSGKSILICTNYSDNNKEIEIRGMDTHNNVNNLLKNESITIENGLVRLNLEQFEVFIGELE